MVLHCIEVNHLRKACLPARGYCNRRLQCCRTTQFSVAEVESGNCKYGICALLCAPPRFSPVAYAENFHGGVRSGSYGGHLYLVCALCDVTIWRHFHVSKPTFWRSLLT